MIPTAADLRQWGTHRGHPPSLIDACGIGACRDHAALWSWAMNMLAAEKPNAPDYSEASTGTLGLLPSAALRAPRGTPRSPQEDSGPHRDVKPYTKLAAWAWAAWRACR